VWEGALFDTTIYPDGTNSTFNTGETCLGHGEEQD